MIDTKGNLLPSEYNHREMIVKDDFANIEVVLAMDNHVDQFNTNGIVSAVTLLDEKPSLSDSPSAFSSAV